MEQGARREVDISIAVLSCFCKILFGETESKRRQFSCSLAFIETEIAENSDRLPVIIW